MGSSIYFSGLKALYPPKPEKTFSNNIADFLMGWKNISIGNISNTASILKKSCTIPALNAFLNSTRLVICPNDTKVFVIVVPIFAPIIMGMAELSVSAPPATKPTTNEVVVEEL